MRTRPCGYAIRKINLQQNHKNGFAVFVFVKKNRTFVQNEHITVER